MQRQLHGRPFRLSTMPRLSREGSSGTVVVELRVAQGKLDMFLAINRVSKFTYVRFRDEAGKMNGVIIPEPNT